MAVSFDDRYAVQPCRLRWDMVEESRCCEFRASEQARHEGYHLHRALQDDP
jgi:hypothetical protein